MIPTRKILIVDDHPAYRKSLKMLLEHDERICATEAENGLECMEIMAQHPFDLVLMDIQMPGMNGIEATRLVQKKYPTTVILGISMHSSYSAIKAMEEAGALGFVKKGGDIKTIFKAIEALLQGKRFFKLESKKI